MRPRPIIIPVVLMLIFVASAAGASDWYDFENCAFCQKLTEDPGLLDHSTWENHPIANGMMNIMTVAPEFAAAMTKAMAAMSDLGAKMQSGELNPMTVQTCTHCRSLGMLMMSGTRIEVIEGEGATVTLYTSDDPGLIARLHEQAKRDTAEMALLHTHGSAH